MSAREEARDEARAALSAGAGEATPNARRAEALRDDVCVLLLADIAPRWRLWGWSRIAAGGAPLRHEPGLLFAKALGSGYEGGFGLRPSASRQGLFAAFADADAATDFAEYSPLVQRYRERSGDFVRIVMRATSSRGAWSGHSLMPTRPARVGARVAALTRASIRPLKAWRFWRHAPAAQRDLQRAPGCHLAVGLGEAPLLRQATFSVWAGQAEMDAYARSGAHLHAIQAAAREGYFAESLFARFEILQVHGRWQGVDHG